MKPNISFPDISHELNEKRKIAQFNEAHDVNDPIIAWRIMLFIVIGILLAIPVSALVIMLIMKAPVWFTTIITLSFIAWLLIHRSARVKR